NCTSYLFIHSLISFTHSPISQFTHSLIHSFTHSLIHSFPIHPFTHSPLHPFTHSPIHPFTHSLIHSFTHCLHRHLPSGLVFPGPEFFCFRVLDDMAIGGVAIECCA